MPRLGAHMSIAGGLPNAIERGRIHGCEALQIFSKNASQWRARELPLEEIASFRQKAEESGIFPIVAHASYLINLATTSPVLRAQSIAAFGEELDRAEALGLLGVVLHPGAYTSGSEEEGLRLIANGLREVLASRRKHQTLVLLEHTAGQGTSLGYRFEQLRAIIDHMNGSPRVGVCLDTCHLLASGYDVCSGQGYRETFRAFEKLVGLDRLKVFHLNDSKRPCESRVDRHEHIGRGCLGLEPFRWILNDRKFAHLPMLIETEKAPGRERNQILIDPLDRMNLETLRGLLKGKQAPRAGTARRNVR
jgi:deoxyribonuclease IV